MRLLRPFFILLILFSFSQCQKDISYIGGPDTQPTEPALPAPITARLQGIVLNENGVPASGVTVYLGTQTTTTDVRGNFRFQTAQLDKKSSVVRAEKAGYFKAYRTFAATSGTNQVEIKLIKKVLTGTIDAATGGNVSLSNGGKVVLPANGIVKASDNSNYSGTVNVYATYIDPTSADIRQTVPGSFMANDLSGGRVTLTSYGMMAVVLESTTSEKLQIKTGSVSSLTTPIPASMLSSAPATIPMWSVNEQTGIWTEDGTATKQGNVYVGDVKHYSFWNCDVPMNAITLSMTIKNNNGTPMIYGHVRIKRLSPLQQTYGITDSLGQVSGFVPKNETLVLEVIDQCSNPFFTQTIGPFSANTDLGVITLGPATSINIINVTGKLLNCSNNPVANGFARIYYGYYTSYAATDANGNFSTSFSTCASAPTTVDILGVDNTSMQQSALSTVAVTNPVTSAGNINVCGTSAVQFINYTVNGTPYTIGSGTDSLTAFTSGNGTNNSLTTFINGNQATTSSHISFYFTHSTGVAGTYPVIGFSVNTVMQGTPDPGSTVTITNYPTAPGQFYEGNFTIRYGGGANTVLGTFKIRK